MAVGTICVNPYLLDGYLDTEKKAYVKDEKEDLPMLPYKLPDIDTESRNYNHLEAESSVGNQDQSKNSEETHEEEDKENITTTPNISISPNVMEVIESSMKEEKELLSNLRDQMVSLEKHMKLSANENEKKAKEASKVKPGVIALSFEFPSKLKAKDSNKKAEVDDPKKKSSDSNNSKNPMSTTTPDNKSSQIRIPKQLPIPVIYVQEDADSSINHGIIKALEHKIEEILLSNAHILSNDQVKEIPKDQKIQDIQMELNRIAAKKKYYETDIKITNKISGVPFDKAIPSLD